MTRSLGRLGVVLVILLSSGGHALAQTLVSTQASPSGAPMLNQSTVAAAVPSLDASGAATALPTTVQAQQTTSSPQVPTTASLSSQRNASQAGTFWILPSEAPSTDEMAGWTLVESDRDIPIGFCFSSKLAAIPCQSSFFSFGALSMYGGNDTLFASGETQAGAVVKFSTKFSTSALHRYAFTGTNMIFSNKKRDAYWAINATSGQIAMVPQVKASKFTMYKRSNGQGPILLKSGSRFVALSITGMYASQTVTTEHLFLPPQQQYESTMVDTMDAELMGYRVNALSNGGKLSPAWMAYDLALVIPLRDQPKGPQFTQFRMNQAGSIDLSPMFSKFFRLVANKMVKEYDHYPSLGRHLPQDLMLHQVAEGIKTQRADVWPSVARTFVKTVPLPDTTEAAVFLASAAFAAAKFKAEANANRLLLSTKDEKTEAWMAAYYRSSCALAWKRSELPLMQKLNQTDLLVDTTNIERLTRTMTTTSQAYWFTEILKRPVEKDTAKKNAGVQVTTVISASAVRKTWESSWTLMELGLMYHLDARFVQQKTTIGESFSEPISKEIDRALGTAMNLDAVYRLVSDNSTRELMEVVDVICRTKLLEIEACLLPQIFRQTGLFSMYSRNITDPSVVTSLQTTTSIDYSAYMKLVEEDAAAAALKSNIIEAKQDFIKKTKSLTETLNTRVEDAVIKTAMDSSKQIAKLTSGLTQFMEKTSSFQARGLSAQLSQRMTEIEGGQKRVKETRTIYLSELNAIASIAKIRSAINAFVAVVETAFSVFDFANSFRKGAFPDLGGAADALGGFEQSVNAINTASNTVKLKEYADGLAKELSSIVQRMQHLAPALTRVREAAKPLTSEKTMSGAALASASQQLLEALRDYKAPVSVTELNSLQSRFQAVGDQLCIVAELPTDKNCINMPGRNEMIFTSLVENVRSGEDAMDLLKDMCAEAVNAQTLRVLSDKVKENAAEAADLTTLKKKWGNDASKKNAWWFQWNKKQRYLTTAATAGTVLQQVYMLSALVAKCNEETYLNGGVPSASCKNVIYSGQPIRNENVASLTAPMTRAGTWTTLTRSEALIPTEPSFPGDLAYIDLAKLLDGQPVYFKLPLNNATWLKNYGWMSSEADVAKYVYLVKSFQLFLPPRFADYSSSPGSAEIVVESRPLSNLGPGMQGKTYLIKPVKYKTEYTYGDGGVSEDSCQALSYHQCNRNLPQYCLRSDGLASVTSGLLPSLFSEWVITAKVEGSGGSAPRIGYRKASTPLLLQAQVQMDRMSITPPISSTTTSSSVGLPTTASASLSVPMASTGGNLSPSVVSTSLNNSLSSQRRLRHAVVEAGSILVGERAVRKGGSNTSCCSQTTEYRVLVDGRYDCVSCPKDSISQLGGLYCIPDPRQSQ